MNKLLLSILSVSSLCAVSSSALAVMDQNGNPQTTRKEYYDSLGRSQGYSQANPYTNRTQHYDSLGRSQGYSQRSYSGEIQHYDHLGRYQGSTRDR